MKWDRIVLLGFVIFGLLMAYWGYQMVNTDYDLIHEKPYEEGLSYQRVIDKKQRTQALSQQPQIVYQESTQQVIVRFPNPNCTGKIELTRPSNSNLDFSLPIKINTNQEQIISTQNLKPGSWKITLKWKQNGEDFELSKNLYINKI